MSWHICFPFSIKCPLKWRGTNLSLGRSKFRGNRARFNYSNTVDYYYDWNYLVSWGFLKKRLDLGHSEAVQSSPRNGKNERQEWKAHCNWLEEEHFSPVARADPRLQVNIAQQSHEYNKNLGTRKYLIMVLSQTNQGSDRFYYRKIISNIEFYIISLLKDTNTEKPPK